MIRVGSFRLVNGSQKPEAWVDRALRRAAWRSALSAFVAVDGRTIGALLLDDELRRETPRAVQALRTVGVSRIIMVTGDRAEAAETIGAALDLDASPRGGLLKEQKSAFNLISSRRPCTSLETRQRRRRSYKRMAPRTARSFRKTDLPLGCPDILRPFAGPSQRGLASRC